MKILISAAETSSDIHGAQLLKALRELLPASEPLEAFGIGGPLLEKEGLRALVDARGLLAMGFLEILSRLPRIFRSLRTLSEAALEERPQVAVVLDYPDFHFKLARRLRRAGIPMVYYIPPKVWVWRKGRIRLLRRLFARVLCIFPFEEEFFRREKLASARYVGNPLVEELPLGLSRDEARRKLGLSDEAKVLAVLPGSRPSELKRHLELMLAAADQTARGIGAPVIGLMPLPLTADLEELRARVDALRERFTQLEVRLSVGDSHLCMVAADLGMVKSGTSTLEAALLGCVHTIVYRPNGFTAWVFKNLIRYRGPVGLANLVAGTLKKPYLIREILMEEATPAAIAGELVSLWKDPARVASIRAGLGRVRALLEAGGEKPSHQAAREILRVAAGGGR